VSGFQLPSSWHRDRIVWVDRACRSDTRQENAQQFGGVADPTAIEQWITQLNDDEFPVREKATKRLAANLDTCRARLGAELRQATSEEVRARLATLLAETEKLTTKAHGTERQIQRILKVMTLRLQ
jgi:hypothetical protein